MAAYTWHGKTGACRVRRVDIFVYTGKGYFDCAHFSIEFLSAADARDFVSTLNRDEFDAIEPSGNWEFVSLKPKHYHSCRKALVSLQGYDFPSGDIKTACKELCLPAGRGHCLL